MSFLSKLFGKPKQNTVLYNISDAAMPREVISIAVKSLVDKAGGNCATLEVVAKPNMWIQIMDLTINCHYPHRQSPELRYPELVNQRLVESLIGFEEGVYMTVSLNDMNQSEIVAWIEQYLSKVLSVDLSTDQVRLKMEDL